MQKVSLVYEGKDIGNLRRLMCLNGVYILFAHRFEWTRIYYVICIQHTTLKSSSGTLKFIIGNHGIRFQFKNIFSSRQHVSDLCKLNFNLKK